MYGKATPLHIELDPVIARQQKIQRDYRLNVFQIPRLRFLGMGVIGLSVFLHNLIILRVFSWETLCIVSVTMLGYCTLSWGALYYGYGRFQHLNLSLLFLIADVGIILMAVYYSGADQSWLFFLLIGRVADQAHVRFSRALLFAHLTACGYLLLIVYVAYGEHRPVDWPVSGVKTLSLYGMSIYIAFTARAAEKLRNRTRAAIHLGRDLIGRLEEQTQQLTMEKSRAEAASRAKSVFLTNMSHELRTPMNGILGMTEIALHSPLTPEQRKYLRAVQASGNALLKLLNSMLEFSQMDSGEIVLEARPFALRQTLADTLDALAMQARQKHLTFSYSVQADVPDTLLGDRQRLCHILQGLVENAIKFTSTGGIRIVVTRAATDHTSLHFAVTDTGIGIPVEKQQTIFEAFVQADESMTRVYSGIGLGLAIVARLVARMEGRIWVESTPHQGSTFHFTARLLPPLPAFSGTPLSSSATPCHSAVLRDHS